MQPRSAVRWWLPGVEYQNVFDYLDNLTLIHGKHSLKFGTEIRQEEFPILEPRIRGAA